MEYFLLQIFAFFRPILFINVPVKIAGFNLFEITAIIFFIVLSISFIYNIALTRDLRFSVIDFAIVGFILWCVSIYIVYIESAKIGALAKLVIPPFTYIVAKNILVNTEQYLRIIRLLIIGFFIPIVASAMLIMSGKGVDIVNYWTQVTRYGGVYNGAHSMAHNMTFLLMLVTLYVSIKTVEGGAAHRGVKKLEKMGYIALSIVAIYNIYKGGVRTTIVGLLVFLAIYLYNYYRKSLLVLVVVGAILAILFSPVLIHYLAYDYEKVKSGEWSADQLGSGRPSIWMAKLSAFSRVSFDKQIAGVGLGNRDKDLGLDTESWGQLDSHNDFLEILVQTGIVGLFLFLLLNYLILRKILGLERRSRYLFLSLFVAVMVMNFVSNSYVNRFGLGQMFYLVLSYIELPRRKEIGGDDL